MCGLDLILICVSGLRISLSGCLFSIGFDLRPYLDVALFGVSCRVPHRIQLKPYVDVACFGVYWFVLHRIQPMSRFGCKIQARQALRNPSDVAKNWNRCRNSVELTFRATSDLATSRKWMEILCQTSILNYIRFDDKPKRMEILCWTRLNPSRLIQQP